MIKYLSIQNFKSHKKTDLEIGNLTLLCGQNGVGKSSVIQSLLLLRQSKDFLHTGLSLNKPLCYIGKGNDALYQYAEDEKIFFLLSHDNGFINFSFNAEKHLTSDFIINESTNPLDNINPSQIALFSNDFQYISAYRGVNYLSNDYLVENERQISIEEGKAELTAQFLFKYQNEKVIDELLCSTDVKEDNVLLYEVNYWEKKISSGVNILPQKIGSSYEIYYNFDSKKGSRTNDFTSKNVGFGISYSLPVILSILSARKDSLILIENPEAHLHPYGQSKLAELIAIAAQAGVQIIVETHSDHIINGILVATKRFEEGQGGISRENVKLYYFDRDDETQTTITNNVEILEGGRIVYPPIGFFDQISKDRRILMGF